MEKNRFELVSSEEIKMDLGFLETFVLKDKHTGVLYLYTNRGNGGGLTPLVDSQGKPLIG